MRRSEGVEGGSGLGGAGGAGGGVGSALQERPLDPEDGEAPEEALPAQGLKREFSKGLFIQPIVIALALGGWALWRANANLTTVQERTLGWRAIGTSAVQHLKLTVVSTIIVLLIAIPLGILLTRAKLRRVATPVTFIANIGQAAPAIGLFVLLAIGLSVGFWTAVLALCAYALLPVLANTIVGLRGVDERLVEAGRGQGMSALAVLFRVELPLAVPVMLTGVRTALVLLVGTATLATFIDGGGLGILITTGINLFQTPLLLSGALLVALLALTVDWLGRLFEEFARPKGL
jgi:osmoprotectant transport system permease protein